MIEPRFDDSGRQKDAARRGEAWTSDVMVGFIAAAGLAVVLLSIVFGLGREPRTNLAMNMAGMRDTAGATTPSPDSAALAPTTKTQSPQP